MTSAFTPRLPPLAAGDPAPNFKQHSSNKTQFTFDNAAGRYLVLCFYGSAADPHAQAALSAVHARPDLFDDTHASFFGVSCDPADQAGRVQSRIPGYRHFFDSDLKIAKLYKVLPSDAGPEQASVLLGRIWCVIDPTMRIIAVVPFQPGQGDIEEVLRLLKALPPPDRFAGVELMAPVLYLPRVFEPELCQHLIGLYEAEGGMESGVMREVAGKTVGVLDAAFKRRKDITISDQGLITVLQDRILRSVVPEIAKVHQFRVTRMERYIVSCYSAEDGGHFSAHRDNTTRGTAHRRFAVSINLNDDFDGGEVNFPEYGSRSFKAPPGGAVVFSCSLLHRVSKVVRGRRYAFLPFLYDDAAAAIRRANMQYLSSNPETAEEPSKAPADPLE